MTRYEILFFRNDGSEAMRKIADCADDREARILAHSLWEKGLHGFKVFRVEPDHPRIYQRPECDGTPSARLSPGLQLRFNP